MIDTNDLQRHTDDALKFKNMPEMQANQALSAIEMVREERIKILLDVLNNPYCAEKMGANFKGEVVDTILAAASLYNKELRQDPEIRDYIRRDHESRIDSLLR